MDATRENECQSVTQKEHHIKQPPWTVTLWDNCLNLDQKHQTTNVRVPSAEKTRSSGRSFSKYVEWLWDEKQYTSLGTKFSSFDPLCIAPLSIGLSCDKRVIDHSASYTALSLAVETKLYIPSTINIWKKVLTKAKMGWFLADSPVHQVKLKY